MSTTRYPRRGMGSHWTRRRISSPPSKAGRAFARPSALRIVRVTGSDAARLAPRPGDDRRRVPRPWAGPAVAPADAHRTDPGRLHGGSRRRRLPGCCKHAEQTRCGRATCCRSTCCRRTWPARPQRHEHSVWSCSVGHSTRPWRPVHGLQSSVRAMGVGPRTSPAGSPPWAPAAVAYRPRPGRLGRAGGWRILRGDPRMGPDFDEGALPSEAGLDATIDATKGCFLGQESVAKIRNLGHPPTVLRHRRPDRRPSLPASLVDDDGAHVRAS